MSRICSALALLCILAGTAGAASARGETPMRLDTDVVPVAQSVTLRLDPGRPDYSGSVEISLRVRKAADRFRFHSQGLTLGETELSGPDGPLPVTLGPETDRTVEASVDGGLAPGEYTLRIAFTNTYDTTAVSLYRTRFEDADYLFTQFEAADARGAFPCWDEPSFKIPWRLTVAVPRADTVVANGPPVRETEAGGWKTVAFEETPPLPSYLLALAVGPFDAVPIPGLAVPGRVITARGKSALAAAAAAEAPAILDSLQDWFGSPYPFTKLDLIAVPEFWPGAMENPGLVTFADRVLLLDPRGASPAQREGLVRVVAHELAHMWFGDLVTMEWWDDLWLNESFADWMGDKITHRVHPEFRHDVGALDRIQQTMTEDAGPSARPVRNPEAGPDNLLTDVGLAYNKGKAVLGMIETWIGPEVFQAGVRAYLAEHARGNARAEDLWRALEEASGDELAATLASFVEQPGVPLVTVDLLPDGRLRLTQSRFHTAGVSVDPVAWRVPVRVLLPEPRGARLRTVLLAGPDTVLDSAAGRAPDWIYPNAGGTGYYRWSVPAEQLLALARSASTVLAPAERVEFLGNLSALLDAGEIHGDVYLSVLERLGGDPDPFVVMTVVDALGRVRDTFVGPDLAGAYGDFVRRTLDPALDRFGLEPRADEPDPVALLRPDLLRRLGTDGAEPRVRDYADSLTRVILNTPSAAPPSLVEAALRISAHHGDRALLDALTGLAESTPVPAVRGAALTALGGFTDPELRRAALDYALGGRVRSNETLIVGRAMEETEPGRDAVYAWLTGNYAAVTAKIPPILIGFLPGVADGASAPRLEAAREFFGDPAHQAPGTGRTLERVTAQVEARLALRAREGDAVRRFLTAGETEHAGQRR